MKTNYPTSIGSIGSWAKENNIPLAEVRTRFAQYTVLEAIASSKQLQQALVFKGGNALDFIWQPNRSTRDLDFSLDSAMSPSGIDEERLGDLLEIGLKAVQKSSGLMLRIGRVKRQPPGAEKTLTTYHASAHYAFPDQERHFRLMEADPRYRSPATIPLDVSTYEPICGVEFVQLHGGRSLRVCTLEDIVADKLRSLLQQPGRNRTRRQDLLDIAVIRLQEKPLDLDKVKMYLLEKSTAVHLPVSRQAFDSPEIMDRAQHDYDLLVDTVRTRFIPFDEARNVMYSLVDALDLPEEASGTSHEH